MSSDEGVEAAFVFDCGGAQLPAILHHGGPEARRGVLIVVGGPQYRVGSHRQFVLFARALAAGGVPTMRFDYRGMGDAGGEDVGFEGINDDIHAAIDAFVERQPSVREVVLWGLCDAASAALFYAARDERVTGLVLLNPWVRTEQGEAKAYLKHYYRGRLLSSTTWKRLLLGELSVLAAMRSIAGLARRAMKRERGSDDDRPADLPTRMLSGLRRFRGRTLILISGRDLTAAEFLGVVAGSAEWRSALAGERVERVDFPHANHTFSSRADRDAVTAATLSWLDTWPESGDGR